jgi:hypothetical protein
MKVGKSALIIVPMLVAATTAFAQSGQKAIILQKKNDATTSAGTHALNPQPIPPGKSHELNPQPIPPGISHELNPQPIPPGKYHALNPQPIPPGVVTNGTPKKKKKKKRKLD